MRAAGLKSAAPEGVGTIEVFATGGAMAGSGTAGATCEGAAHGSPQADAPGADFLDVFGLSMFEPTREKALSRFRSYLADPSVTMLVHRAIPSAGDGREGRVDGCIAYRRLGDGLELINIGTAPEARGRGLGRRLIEAAMGREGPATVRLETDNDAVGFYRRCGFSVSSLGEKYPGIERFECRLIPRREASERIAMKSTNAT